MIPAHRTDNCIMCLRTLSPWERHYYEYRCEGCEMKFHERMTHWMRGAEDKELEELFGDHDGSS